MKYIFSAILMCILGSLLQVAAQQPVQLHGQLQVKGIQLCNQKGEPVVLRGMSFGWHNFWPRFYNKQTVSWLHQDWGCTVVRAAMGIEPRGGYKQNREGSVRLVKEVVDGAIASGIYVIIDWHSHNINLEEAKAFFAQMAQEYGQHPNVIYEVFNEPERQSWEEVKAYSAEVIRTIRQYDPDNVILVGSPHWDQDVHLAADAPLQGFDNLMYTLHYYAATHKQGLRDRGTYALKKGLPLFISESAGMEATGDGPLNEEEWLKWIDWAEQNKISWVTWSVSDKAETCSVLLPSAPSGGGWRETDLKESGKKARGLIRKYNKHRAQ